MKIRADGGGLWYNSDGKNVQQSLILFGAVHIIPQTQYEHSTNKHKDRQKIFSSDTYNFSGWTTKSTQAEHGLFKLCLIICIYLAVLN